MNKNYYLDAAYVSRTEPVYFTDNLDVRHKVTHQPHIYNLAAHLGRAYGCTHIIDIGCGQAHKLIKLHKEFELIGVDIGTNIEYCQTHYTVGRWIELDLDNPDSSLNINPEIVSSSIIICADVIEQLVRPELLLDQLHKLLDHAPVALLTTPERDAIYGASHLGPPDNPHHIREWNLDELVELVESSGLKVEFAGYTMNNDMKWGKKTALLILSHNLLPPIQSAPDDFHIVAVMTAYNEGDIITPSIQYLAEQGIEVYLIDNWSEDGTYEQAEKLFGQGLIGLERFPATRPSGSHLFNLAALLQRTEAIAQEIEADWIIHHDVDELRESPWPQVTLRDAIYRVDCCGFNSIDHTVIDFRPVDNDYPSGSDFGNYFQHHIFGKRAGHFLRINVWKRSVGPVDLATSGGHSAVFENRRVYPYKFLLRHYPFRSAAQAQTKIYNRQKRSLERVRGWHRMYDHLKPNDDQFFSEMCRQTRADYSRFDPETFYTQFLVERLTGIGLEKQNKPLLQRLQQKAYRMVHSSLKKLLHFAGI